MDKVITCSNSYHKLSQESLLKEISSKGSCVFETLNLLFIVWIAFDILLFSIIKKVMGNWITPTASVFSLEEIPPLFHDLILYINWFFFFLLQHILSAFVFSKSVFKLVIFYAIRNGEIKENRSCDIELAPKVCSAFVVEMCYDCLVFN